MPNLFKSAVKETVQVSDPYNSSVKMVQELIASLEQHLPAGFVDNVSALYAKASHQVVTLTQDKTQGELIFMGSIFAAVLFFVVILPAREALSSTEPSNSKSTVVQSVSSNSSATESLHTIEESEEEDNAPEKEEIINKSIEVPDSLNSQTADDELTKFLASVDASEVLQSEEAEIDASEKLSESTPMVETPISSPPATPQTAELTLTKETYASTPDMYCTTSIPRKSSMAKLKAKSSRLFGRKNSDDVSVASAKSTKSLFGRKGSSDDVSVASTKSRRSSLIKRGSISKSDYGSYFGLK